MLKHNVCNHRKDEDPACCKGRLWLVSTILVVILPFFFPPRPPRPPRHLLTICFVFSHLFPFFHQSFQGMLSSLHSELDIQRYLMKIRLPHRVSQPFLYLTCIMACVRSFLHALTAAWPLSILNGTSLCACQNLLGWVVEPVYSAEPPTSVRERKKCT